MPEETLYRSAQRFGIASLAIALGGGSGILLALRPKYGLAALALFVIVFMILRKPETGLYLIVAVLPFEQLTSLSENFSAIKLISLLTFISWSIRLARTRQSSIDFKDKRNVFLFVFLAAGTLSLVEADKFTPALVHLATLFFLAISYFMVSDLSSDKKTSLLTMKILAISTGLAATIPISQFILSGGLRAAGACMEPGKSGLNLIVILPLAVAFAVQTKGWIKKSLFWLTFLLILIGTVTTISRGPLTAMFAMLLLIIVGKFPRPWPKRVLIAFFLAMILSVPVMKYLSPRLTLEEVATSRAAGRFELWYAGGEMFADNWLLGIGLANFPDTYYRYSTHIPWFIHRQPTAAHNLFVETAVETGFFGIVAFLGFIFISLYQLWRSRLLLLQSGNVSQGFVCSMLTVSIIGLLVASLAYSTLFQKIPWVLLGLAAGFSNWANAKQPLEITDPSSVFKDEAISGNL